MLKGDEKGTLARVPFSILFRDNKSFDLLKNEFITPGPECPVSSVDIRGINK